MMRWLLSMSLAVTLLSGCGNDEKPREDMTVSVGFEYLREHAHAWAGRFLSLGKDELQQQGVLLDVRCRIDRLGREVSPTHARIFEEAFIDSVAKVKPEIGLTSGSWD